MTPLKKQPPKPTFFEKTQNWFLHKIPQLVAFSLFLIIFSFLAPLLFTQSPSIFDFTETGQIGDTLGGIMNPFIAMAGVFTTFLAFLMQYKANEQQRKQFFISMRKGEIDEKVDCYNKLQLLKNDIDFCYKDLIIRHNDITQYYNNIIDFPYKKGLLYRKDLNVYHRLQSVDRFQIYKSFQLYIDNKNRTECFDNLFPLFDEIPNTLNTLNDIIASNSQHCNTYRKNFDKLMFQIISSIKIYLHNNKDVSKDIHHDRTYKVIKDLYHRFEVSSKSKGDQETGIIKIAYKYKTILEKISSSDDIANICKSIDDLIKNHNSFCQEISETLEQLKLYLGILPDFGNRMKESSNIIDQALIYKNNEEIRKHWDKEFEDL